MAVNPKLFTYHGEQLPIALDNEFFILNRRHIQFNAKSASERYKAKGQMYLTSSRVVFCAESLNKKSKDFEAFEIPLAQITQHAFKQPVFGASKLVGQVQLQEEVCEWSLEFVKGGVGKLLPVFLQLMQKTKQVQEKGAEYVAEVQRAYMDPTDPSTIYIKQPRLDCV